MSTFDRIYAPVSELMPTEHRWKGWVYIYCNAFETKPKIMDSQAISICAYN